MQSPSPSAAGIARQLLALEPRWAVAGITSLSTLLSVLLTTVMSWLFSVPPPMWLKVQLMGLLIPLVVATILGYVMVRMVHALDRARQQVHVMAMTDDLTGVMNRRHFMQIAEAEFTRASRFELQLSVLMMDADHFKRVNDKHGHAVGDEVLRGLAQAVAASLRDHDMLGRYGGEELIALLPHTDAANAVLAAQRVRATVAALRFEGEDGEIFSVTVSVGVGVFHRPIESWEALLDDADKALYRAKRNGRNRVEMNTA